MASFRGQASWTKMMPLGGKLRALACHPTEKVYKAEKQTYLSTNKHTSLFWDSSKKFYKTVPRFWILTTLEKTSQRQTQPMAAFSPTVEGIFNQSKWWTIWFSYQNCLLQFLYFFKLKNSFLFKYFSKKWWQ